MIYFLKSLELAKLVRRNRNVMPDEVNIGMSQGIVFLGNLSLGRFKLLMGM